jgi:hypothetical protein
MFEVLVAVFAVWGIGASWFIATTPLRGGSERTTRVVPIESARARSSVAGSRRVARGGDPPAVRDDPFIGYIHSHPVPRELLIDILRLASNHDLTPRVADAHSAHIRALLRGERRGGAQFSRLPPARRRRRGVSGVALEGLPTQGGSVGDLRLLGDRQEVIAPIPLHHSCHEYELARL